jgi:hypothetical protein
VSQLRVRVSFTTLCVNAICGGLLKTTVCDKDLDAKYGFERQVSFCDNEIYASKLSPHIALGKKRFLPFKRCTFIVHRKRFKLKNYSKIWTTILFVSTTVCVGANCGDCFNPHFAVARNVVHDKRIHKHRKLQEEGFA